MENQPIIAIQKNELVQMTKEITRALARELRTTSDFGYFGYLKFPEDIIAITGGYIAESTIRGWKSHGYLRTFPIGSKSYVTRDDWEWFLSNHKELMSKNTRNRAERLSKKGAKK